MHIWGRWLHQQGETYYLAHHAQPWHKCSWSSHALPAVNIPGYLAHCLPFSPIPGLGCPSSLPTALLELWNPTAPGSPLELIQVSLRMTQIQCYQIFSQRWTFLSKDKEERVPGVVFMSLSSSLLSPPWALRFPPLLERDRVSAREKQQPLWHPSQHLQDVFLL